MASVSDILKTYEDDIVHCIFFIIMFTIPIIITIRLMNTFSDPDIWWHLRTGQWILENKTVPAVDPFSQHHVPWVAYSWLFEILIYGMYNLFGLTGFGIYLLLMAVAITFSLYTLLKNQSISSTFAASLTAVGIIAISRNLNVRSYLFSILFSIILLQVLMKVRESGQMKKLILLPPVFALWANLHIQFVYGFMIYFLFAVEVAGLCYVSKKGDSDIQRTRMHWMLSIGAACFLATLANPYHVFIYRPFVEILAEPGFYNHISELHSLCFRHLADWMVLFIFMGAVYTIGKNQTHRPFLLLLILAASFISFRSIRDVWLVVISGLTIIAYNISRRQPDNDVLRYKKIPVRVVSGLGTVLSLFICWNCYALSNASIHQHIAENYPEKATQFIKKNNLSGPLYNHFNWGGYLIWHLPELPVSIDGRGNVCGYDNFLNSINTFNAKPDWDINTKLLHAGIVVTSPEWALTSLLRKDGRFKIAYEDKVALVFVRSDIKQQPFLKPMTTDNPIYSQKATLTRSVP